MASGTIPVAFGVQSEKGNWQVKACLRDTRLFW